MPFSFSFSTSAAVVTSGSVNGRGTTQGVAYRREAYSNEHGSGVRTTRQTLGEAPVVRTRMYDPQGRPLLIQDQDARRSGNGATAAAGSNTTTRRVLSIEDVTDQDEEREPQREEMRVTSSSKGGR